MIQVEMAGPRVPSTFDIAPDEIRNLANLVFIQCGKGEDPTGGFLTTDMSYMKQWITSEEFAFETPYRKYFQCSFAYFKFPCQDHILM